MAEISLGEIIARGNREEAKSFISKYGFRPTNNEGDLAMTINRIILMGGDEALNQLMKIHPDREALISTIPKEDEFSNATGYEKMLARDKQQQHSNCCGHSNASGKYHNCSGCGGSCGGNKMMNADGNGGNNNPANVHVDLMGKQMFYTIMGVALIFGFIALTRTDRQRA